MQIIKNILCLLLTLIGFIFLMLFNIVIIKSIYIYIQDNFIETSNWVSTTAIIKEIKLYSQTRPIVGDIYIEYYYDDTNYCNESYPFSNNDILKYKGQNIKIKYNPNNPTQFIVNINIIRSLIFRILALIFGLSLTFVLIKKLYL